MKAARRIKPVNVDQLPLPAVAPPEPPVAVPANRAAAPDSALARSELLKARSPRAAEREQVLAAVAFLRARNGVASAAAFAQELGDSPSRAGGVVAKLQEVLNLDGYEMLRFDRQNQQVHLDVAKLVQQFELGAHG